MIPISVVGRQTDGTYILGADNAYNKEGDKLETWSHDWLWIPQPDIKSPKIANPNDSAARELYAALEESVPQSTFCSMLLAAGKLHIIKVPWLKLSTVQLLKLCVYFFFSFFYFF